MNLLQFVILHCLFFSISVAKEIKFREWNEESFDFTSAEHGFGSAIMVTKVFELTHKHWGDRNSKIVAFISTSVGGILWEVGDGLGLLPPETAFSFRDLFWDGVGVFTGLGITYLGDKERGGLEQIISTGGIVCGVYDAIFLKRTNLSENICRLASVPIALVADALYDAICGDSMKIIFLKDHILLNLTGVALGFLCTFWEPSWEYSHRARK